MASRAMSELIFFIASVLIASVVAGALYMTTQNIADGVKDKGVLLARSLKMDFAIINDPESIPLVNGYYVFYIKNIGKESFLFNSNGVTVLIDGEIVSSTFLSFENIDNPGSEVLDPHDIGKLLVNSTIIDTSSQYHKITIILVNGKKRSLVFKI
ncbi:hypothetical protein PAP_04465 [Palaeococcus pacificus DY20341]|uniref:Flagellar protein G n=1 Tax=Palaeococcus pacificus DY20341 TaxID=1343739 RepID=A0A075LSM0_9EURY|nr:flagellar protein G [Palaeococcus pacificus]AIF69304.1 hypothetical protein PAP_04465 [Palaeococcus pacificus DY20341]